MARRLIKMKSNIFSLKQVYIFFIMIIISAIMIFPLFWIISISFKGDTEQFITPPTIVPIVPVLSNYYRLINETNFLYYIMNSFIVANITVLLALGFGCPAAYAMARFKMLSRPVFTSGVLLTYMFPPILLGIPLFVIFSKIGLADSYAGLIFAHTTFALPFVMWMMRDFFLAVPIEIEEAAMVDGCSRLRALFTIIIPIARPGLVAAGIFTFMLSWNDYIYALILMKSESRKTISVGISLFIDSTSIEPGLMMAGAVLITVPVLICFMFIQSYLVQGLAMGAVK
jgi:ABC-type glycerol-3-phosphate transport system permease component